MNNFKRQNWGEEQKYSDTKKAIQTLPTGKNDHDFRPFLLSSGQKALYVPQLRAERERDIYYYIYMCVCISRVPVPAGVFYYYFTVHISLFIAREEKEG